MVKKTPQEQINLNLEKIRNLFDETCALADEHNIGFSWDYLGYGMGGYYNPRKRPVTRQEAIEALSKTDYLSEEDKERYIEVLRNTTAETDSYVWESSSYDSSGWQSSSSNC